MLACIHINACTRTHRTIHDQSPIVMFAAKTSPHQFETKCNAGNGVWSNKMRCHILTIILGFLVVALAAILIISRIKRIEMFVKITQLSYICSSTHSKALSKSNVPSTFSICLCIHISLHTITPSYHHTLTHSQLKPVAVSVKAVVQPVQPVMLVPRLNQSLRCLPWSLISL